MNLEALGVVRVSGLTGEASGTAGRSRPALAAALSPVCGTGATCAARRSGRRSGRRPSSSSDSGPFPNGDIGGSSAEVSLRGDDLVVECAELQSRRRPRVEVVRGGDSSAGAVALADRPVLVEGRGALDRRLIDALSFVDVVCRAVRGETALERRAGGGVVGAEVLDNVVLDERAGGPSVHGEVAVAARVVRTAEGDRPSSAGEPSLSSDKVAACAPAYAVLSTRPIGICDGGTTVSPEGIVVAIAGAGTAWRSSTNGGRSNTSGDVAGKGRDPSNSEGSNGAEERVK